MLAAEEKLANLVSDSIRPRLIPDIEVVPWRNLNVLAVQVYPSNTRPHYLERLGPQDGAFIRVGSTNRKADALQIEELKRLNWMNSFDEQANSASFARSRWLPNLFGLILTAGQLSIPVQGSRTCLACIACEFLYFFVVNTTSET